MAPKIIEAPDGKMIEFPEDMADSMINLVMAKEYPTGAEQKPMGWGEVARNAVSNLPRSAYRFGESLVSPIIHPMDTIKGVRDVAFGGLEKIIPGAGVEGQEAKFDAFRQLLADRYGGYENIKKTLGEDLVGALADASTVLTGGGSMAARLPGMAGRVGGVAAGVGRAVEPINMVKQLAGGAAMGALPKSAPMRLYESAVKPPSPNAKFPLDKQLETLQAGIDAGIMPSKSGLEKVDDIITGLNDKIMGGIADKSVQGLKVKTPDVIRGLDSAYEFFSTLPESEKYLKMIDEIRDGTLAKGATIPIAQAQKMKQNIYKMLKDSYGEISTATKEANKGIARGIKDEIVSIFPEIKSLNAQESIMLRLEPIIEKAAARIGRRDIVGIGTPITGVTAGTLTGSGKAGASIMLLKSVVDNPSVKAYIAIALNKAKKGGLGPGFVEERLATYWADKMRESE